MSGTEASPPVHPGLTLNHKKTLLRCARKAILGHIQRGVIPSFAEHADAVLTQPRGVFVSLHVGDALRGCIGSLYPDRPVLEAVAEMAVQAATEDPRFSAMGMAELRETAIEISLLSEMRRHPPREVEVGTHGLFISQGKRRALMLPQVATQFKWTREKFLGETCRKAGLGPRAWHQDETQVMVFEAEVFSDHSVAEEADALDLGRDGLKG